MTSNARESADHRDEDELPGAGTAAGGAVDEEASEKSDSKPRSGLAGWPISAAVHALVALVFAYVVFATHKDEEELAPMHISVVDPPPEKQVVKERDIQDRVQLVIEAVSETPSPISDLEVKPEPLQTEDQSPDSTAQGRIEAVATVEDGATGAFQAIGANAGASGRHGQRDGSGHHRAVGINGGTHDSENAVDSALRWFKRHQSPNGMWDAEKYPANCTANPKCEPGSLAAANGSDANIAMTGYALLCFMGRGYDHKTPSRFKATVQKGLEYLRSVQKPDGLLGVRNYEHAVATYALSDAFSMTQDESLRDPAQRAVNVLISRQAKDAAKNADKGYGGLGWDYELANPARNDSSVSGWCVMALKSALSADLKVGTSMDGAKKWLERAWKAANKDWMKLTDPYAATSSFPYVWDATSDAVQIVPPGSAMHDMAPVGALCAVFLGHHAGDPMLESLCNHISRYQFPTKYPCNTYYLYYDTAAMFQAGGERWKRWNGTVRDMLVKAQRSGDDCFDGSWDPQGTVFHGNEVGRVLSTAYCCLCLEVYYRQAIVGHEVK
jgi:hypothetical protein